MEEKEVRETSTSIKRLPAANRPKATRPQGSLLDVRQSPSTKTMRLIRIIPTVVLFSIAIACIYLHIFSAEWIIAFIIAALAWWWCVKVFIEDMAVVSGKGEKETEVIDHYTNSTRLSDSLTGASYEQLQRLGRSVRDDQSDD